MLRALTVWRVVHKVVAQQLPPCRWKYSSNQAIVSGTGIFVSEVMQRSYPTKNPSFPNHNRPALPLGSQAITTHWLSSSRTTSC